MPREPRSGSERMISTTEPHAEPQAERARLRVDGTVQGVGFRPYVYRLARALELSGFVRNDARGVVVEVEGAPTAVDRFVARLPAEGPPLAACDRITREALPARGGTTFTILESDTAVAAEPVMQALVSPDVATCDACLRELLDPADRRYRYPFINCTNCGPRFTIVRGVPYDRPLTTMAAFRMCSRCEAEYTDPGDRRFHAQPNACPTCGPAVRLIDEVGVPIAPNVGGGDAIAAAAEALRGGAILAVKGIGGYHLACLASDERAVARLRERKHRPDKPFALMAADLAWVRRLVQLDVAEEVLIAGRERPIVLARRRSNAPVPETVAPRQRELGVMLPYSPLHHLLLRDVGAPLVMTSGNVSDEPIAYRDDDARERLRDIADLFLVHDRPIETPCDDSVVRVVSVGARRLTTMVRRSRGYAPAPVVLPIPVSRPTLACGGQLKNSYALASGSRAWVGPHVGDLERYETLRAFIAGVSHHERVFGITPDRIVHDRHPEYLSTKYALARADAGAATHAAHDTRVVDTDAIQHHHAHMAACLAEHGHSGPAIGLIFDGAGYGEEADGSATVWGGELLVGDLISVERAGHLWPVRMPGGEQAIREPWRMACSWLSALHSDALPPLPSTLRADVDNLTWRRVVLLARSGIASPWTTSAGRLFDALAALCGIRARVSYEGQAAIEFEAQADPDEHEVYDVPLVRGKGHECTVIDVRQLIVAVASDVERGIAAERIAARAHNGMAYAAAQCCRMIADRRDITTVALSGGVFQNTMLVERTAVELERMGLRVLLPERLPANDGGIAYGQLAVSAARSNNRGSDVH
jgi:hydrogenase maturation protein HypF